jgi:type II secretory pathway pseudopilin PulG
VAEICSFKAQKGFTLVELLTSVMAIIVIGAITTGIVTSTLRGSNKANTIENIRQAGGYVLNQMSKDIEYSKTFDGKNTGFNFDGTKYLTSCPADPDPLESITMKSTEDVLVTYECHDTVLSANNTPLIDTNSAIALQSCSFACSQSATGVPIVTIRFTVGLKNQNNLVENSNSQATFETSVVMRNYAK